MRKMRVVLLFGSIGLLLAACSSSLVSKATDNTGVATTLGGTTLPATTVVATTLGGTTLPDTTVAATTVGESTPTATVPLTLAPTDDSTSPPVATIPPTTAKTTQKTSAKTTTTTTAKTTPPTSPAGPVFASFSVSADNCPSTTVAPGVSFVVVPSKPTVKVSWKVTGPFDMIYDAVDNVDGPNSSGLPATGSETFSRDCNGSHTYYVVAVNKGHKTVKSKVVSSG